MQINVEQLTVKVSFADLKNRSKHVFHFVSILRSTKFFISIRDILINNVITGSILPCYELYVYIVINSIM